MIKLFATLIFFLFGLSCQPSFAGGIALPLSVVPDADGFGINTPAGRKGKIIRVTNLREDGYGSFRHAVERVEPRIIIFEVGGVINLTRELVIKHPYLTIAGQTAPSPGITLKGAGIDIRSHDLLIQHIRIRVGDLPVGPPAIARDAVSIVGKDAFNIVLDHISASWALDEIGSTWGGAHDITIRHSIFSEALNNSFHPKGSHSNGFLVGDKTHRILLIGNLFAHNADRNPRVKGPSSVIILNNIMYNNRNDLVVGSRDGAALVSIVGNVFIDGPNTRPSKKKIYVFPPESHADTRVYQNDNLSVSKPGRLLCGYATPFNPYVDVPPVEWRSFKTFPSIHVEAWVLGNAGAQPKDRDIVDHRLIMEVFNRRGKIIDSQSEVGGWDERKSSYRPFMLLRNPHDDDDDDGYTNIEERLHVMAASRLL